MSKATITYVLSHITPRGTAAFDESVDKGAKSQVVGSLYLRQAVYEAMGSPTMITVDAAAVAVSKPKAVKATSAVKTEAPAPRRTTAKVAAPAAKATPARKATTAKLPTKAARPAKSNGVGRGAPRVK